MISLRKVADRPPFHTERAESVLGIFQRDDVIPAVDGAEGSDVRQNVAVMRSLAQRSLDNLRPLADSLVVESAAQFGAMPSLPKRSNNPPEIGRAPAKAREKAAVA